MNKIIFLDIDGVLNTEYYQGMLQHKGEPWQDEHGALFDPNAVACLKRIIDATGADIVIESSWKYIGLDALKELWSIRKLPGRVIDITPSSINDKYLFELNPDKSEFKRNQSKGMEIASWLIENDKKDAKYVIIDDEYVIMDFQLPFFILTNPYEGITNTQTDRAIFILNESMG